MGEKMSGGFGPPAHLFPITPSASRESAGAATWKLEPPARPRPRVVKFSSERSLGTLFVKHGSVFEGTGMFGKKLGPARGKRVVPAGASLLLAVSEGGARDLLPLASLGPRDLQMVSLSSVGATDEALAHLGGLTWLEWLDLSCSGVTGTGLSHLGGMKLLEQLELWGAALTSDGLAHLPDLPGLRRLTLSINFGLTGGALSHLINRLPALEDLDISNSEIGDEAVPHLGRLTGLRQLNVRYTCISRDGAKELKAALPHCRISNNWS